MAEAGPGGREGRGLFTELPQAPCYPGFQLCGSEDDPQLCVARRPKWSEPMLLCFNVLWRAPQRQLIMALTLAGLGQVGTLHSQPVLRKSRVAG